MRGVDGEGSTAHGEESDHGESDHVEHCVDEHLRRSAEIEAAVVEARGEGGKSERRSASGEGGGAGRRGRRACPAACVVGSTSEYSLRRIV